MSETPAEYYVSKAPEPLRGLDYLRKRIQNWFMALSAEGRCYSIGMALFIVAAIVAAFKRPETGRSNEYKTNLVQSGRKRTAQADRRLHEYRPAEAGVGIMSRGGQANTSRIGKNKLHATRIYGNI